jgi:excisionase family DNA binding protein
MDASESQQTHQSDESLLTPEEVAGRLRVSSETLATWRCTRRVHIPYVKVGSLVRYKPRDVAAYLDGHCQVT